MPNATLDPSEPTREPSDRNPMRSSQLVRIGMLGLLLLGLQVPIFLIALQIDARRETRDEAVAEVTSRFGGAQRIVGPVIRVPYRTVEKETDPQTGRTTEREVLRHALFLPRHLDVTGGATGETRYRGIFEVPVYRSSLTLTGSFAPPTFEDWDVPGHAILWERAELALGISDPRAIRGQPTVTFGGRRLDLEPGGRDLGGCGSSLRARIGGDGLDGAIAFELPLELNGAMRLAFAPVGDTTVATLRSNWADPSFDGRWLPSEREVTDDGFTARWEVSRLGRSYPPRFREGTERHALATETFGVGFLAPVDPYRMAERSVKYELLFLALPFLTIWLFEVLGGLRVHPVQYLFVGAALCLFYLLQLALAEHLGFGWAYGLAAAAVASLVWLYARAVLGAGRHASALGGVIVGLYAYLFILLKEQDFAFLLGSLGLFGALALAMWLTRGVDWYRLEAATRAAGRDGAGP